MSICREPQMKAIILAGGLGTRLAEETDVKPKPMVEVGGRPLLWHIMKHYAHHGVGEFLVPLGYRGDVIRRYFVDHVTLRSTFSVDLRTGTLDLEGDATIEPWLVHLVETGVETNTGGRLLMLRRWLQSERMFLTYGDGVSNVNQDALLAFPRAHGRLATVTAVRPPARFGGLELDGDRVAAFTEKPEMGEGWINGGFFVLEPEVLDYLHGPGDSLEYDVLSRLAEEDQLRAFRHSGFWQCVDTVRDLRLLQGLWSSACPPWKVWP
jgi:glucose-1-phosphate cytidylyltransferase